MLGSSRDVDRQAALGADRDGGPVPENPPSSAWSLAAAPADEDAGFEDELVFPTTDDDWPGQWGAARLGIP